VFDTDVLIIGGGPAGIAAALAARKRGFGVTVADAAQPPIDKACGEGLMPDSLAAASRLGFEIPPGIGFPFRGIRFTSSSKSVAAPFPNGFGRGIRRTVLHSLLIDAADEAGVHLLWGVAATGIDGHSVFLRSGSTRNVTIRARWIFGADGAESAIRRWTGLDSAISLARRFAYRQHFAIPPWTDLVEVWWGKGCQIYVTPIDAQEVCVALISRMPALRLEQALICYFPELYERLFNSRVSSRERGAVTASVRLRNVARGHVALIGDASGSVDAITGEGICLAFRQAEVLAEAIACGDLSCYSRAHPRLALRPHLMARAMLLLDLGTTQRGALSLLSAQPWIFRRLLEFHTS
jgi:flavin-dependent dehydrogenase